MTLQKSPDDAPKKLPPPPVEEVVKVLKVAPDDRTKEDITLTSRFFEEKKFFKTYIEQNNYDVVSQCSKFMFPESYETGEVVITQGDKGDTFYVLLKGKVHIRIIKNHQKFEFTLREYYEF